MRALPLLVVVAATTITHILSLALALALAFALAIITVAHELQMTDFATDIASLIFRWAINFFMIEAAAAVTHLSTTSTSIRCANHAATEATLTHRFQMPDFATDITGLIFHRAVLLLMISTATITSLAATFSATLSIKDTVTHNFQVADLTTYVTDLVSVRTISFLVVIAAAAITKLCTSTFTCTFAETLAFELASGLQVAILATVVALLAGIWAVCLYMSWSSTAAAQLLRRTILCEVATPTTIPTNLWCARIWSIARPRTNMAHSDISCTFGLAITSIIEGFVQIWRVQKSKEMM